MGKFLQGKSIFGLTDKERVSVRIDGAKVDMTNTQAYRFEELQKSRETLAPSSGGGVFDAPRYSLEDAAFRLMVDERSLLQKAVAGDLRLYVDVSGIAGKWRSYGADGKAMESAQLSMQSGFLALPVKSCKALLDQGRADVSLLEYVVGSESLDLHADVHAIFASWGQGNRFFCLTTPKQIAAGDVYLMAPLQA